MADRFNSPWSGSLVSFIHIRCQQESIILPHKRRQADATLLPDTLMRLINIHTLRFENFAHDPPPYAIASHRWSADETTHQDVRDVRNFDSAGFRKVKDFGKAVLSINETVQSSAAWAAMGFQLKCDWLWIDTACINKRDLSELSESINSMFRWYRSAAVCYAYLADVGPMSFHYGAMMDFMRSEWFERGWTLQELLGPGVVVFLAKDWSVIGHKCPYDKPLCDMVCRGFGQRLDFIISRITKIPLAVIRNYSNAKDLSIKERMNWLGTRKTTRPEDVAYCLLGICDVFMSPIYGEGSHAWKRLLAVVDVAKTKDRKEMLSVYTTALAPVTVPYEIAWPTRAWDHANHISRGVLSRTVNGLRDRSQIIWDATFDVDSVLRSNTVTGSSAILPVAAVETSSSGLALVPVSLDCSMQRETEQTELSIATVMPNAPGPILKQNPYPAHAISPETEKPDPSHPTPEIISSSSSSHSLEWVETVPFTGGDCTDQDPQTDTMEAPDIEVGLLKMALSDDTRSDEELKRIWSLLQALTKEEIHPCSDTASESESEQSAVSEEANIASAFSQYHNPWEDYPSCPESKACPHLDLAQTLGDGVNQTNDSACRYGQIDDTVSRDDVLCGNPWAD
jgi:hypothetical protein